MLTRETIMLRTSTMVALSVLLPLAGCDSGDGLERVVVSGSVNFKGIPVEYGQLRFKPQGGTAGPVTIASVRDGRYVADGQGGVPVGEHRVEILSYDMKAVGGQWPGGPGANPPPQLLPAKFNTRSQLNAAVVSSAEPMTLDFDLSP